MNPLIPERRLTMQFHITGRCNLRCRHCYREEGDVQPLSLEEVKEIISQFGLLAMRYNRDRHVDEKPHINLTGGEPLMREDIGEILDFMGGQRSRFTFGLLTNGSLIDEAMVRSFLKNRVSFVQMSIDGDRRTHDALRAPGDYDRTFRTARMLECYGIRTLISFTAHEGNFCHLPHAAAKCRMCGVSKLWSDRLVPVGNGANLQTVSRERLPAYLRALEKARGGKWLSRLFPKTQVSMGRSLQFLGSDETPYRCGAGVSLITVDEFGNVMPCRRMPIPCGNALETSLVHICENHTVFVDLRRERIPDGCRKCEWAAQCRGGAKCQSYAAYGAYDRPDPACPKQNTEK